jgi:hypothetical protein
MREQDVRRTITEIAEHDVPANIDLWPRVREQARSQGRPASWTRLAPATRMGWALLLLALALSLTAVTYAAFPAVTRLFAEPPILDDPTQLDLVQPLALSETLDGLTVTLIQGYADGERVVLGFRVESPDGRRYEPQHFTLTDADGAVLPWIHGYGVSGDSELFGLSLPPGESTHAHVFNASALPEAPEGLANGTLALQLTMDLRELPLPADVTSDPHATSHEGPAPKVVELAPLPPSDVVGPFTFRFNLTRR